MKNLFSLPKQSYPLLYWPDSHKPLQNIIFMIGNRNENWFNYMSLYALSETVGTNQRSLN